MTTAGFVINVLIRGKDHKLVRFEVPVSHIEGSKDYDEVVERAGWWYMNKIDNYSCTGDYRWSVFPIGLVEELKAS